MGQLASVKEAAIKAKAQFGDVSILINNAGIVNGKTIMELNEKDIERTLAVNTVGIIRTIHEFLPGMIANKRGHIITVSSMGGLSGVNKGVDYCGSKFGAVGIDESLRYELQKSGHHQYIKTTCICPYFIDG